MIIDSHCHLTYEPISNNIDETIKRANKDGVDYLLTICNLLKGRVKFALRPVPLSLSPVTCHIAPVICHLTHVKITFHLL